MATRREDFESTPEYRKGRHAEEEAKAIFRANGWYVNPTCNYTADGAPLMRGSDDAIILPDLDVAKNGRRRWVEVKYKTRASWTWTKKSLDHGIEDRPYNHYRRVEQATGTPVYIAIVEGITGRLLIRSLSDLEPFLRRPPFREGNGPDIYWPRSQFEHYSSIEPAWGEPGVSEVRRLFCSLGGKPHCLKYDGQRREWRSPVRELTATEQMILFRYTDHAMTLVHNYQFMRCFDVDSAEDEGEALPS